MWLELQNVVSLRVQNWRNSVFNRVAGSSFEGLASPELNNYQPVNNHIYELNLNCYLCAVSISVPQLRSLYCLMSNKLILSFILHLYKCSFRHSNSTYIFRSFLEAKKKIAFYLSSQGICIVTVHYMDWMLTI